MFGSILPEKKSKRERRLPIFFPPPVKVYLHHAIPLAVILSQPGSQDWFYTNYLQICNVLDNHPYPDEHFQFFPHLFNWYGCPLLDVKYGYYNNTTECVEVCKDWLDSGFYLDFDILDCYLPGVLGYSKEEQARQCLIYGYNDEKQVLYSINFDDKSDLSLIEHSYANFERAFQKTVGYLSAHYSWLNNKYVLRILRPVKRPFSLRTDALKQILHEYRHSCDSAQNPYYAASFPAKKYSNWGISIISHLAGYVRDTSTGLDYRAFHGLWEHKSLMCERLRYLQANALIDAAPEIQTLAAGLRRETDVIRMMVLRYNLDFSQNLSTKLENKLDRLAEQEAGLIDKILALLG